MVVDCDLVSSNSLIVLVSQFVDLLFVGCTPFGPGYNDESVIFNQLGDSPFELVYLRLNSLVVGVGDLLDGDGVLLSDRDDFCSSYFDGVVETNDIFFVELDLALVVFDLALKISDNLGLFVDGDIEFVDCDLKLILINFSFT